VSSSCAACARRGELLLRLGVSLDFRAADLERLWETLELSDEQLIAALGGRRRKELREWHASAAAQPAAQSVAQSVAQAPASGVESSVLRPAGGVERVCVHRDDYPSALHGDRLAPPELHVAGGLGRLKGLLDRPVVAIVGAHRCTDYGMEVAHCLGRDLAAAGVCVIGELGDGISYGAQLGAIEADGASVAVMAGGLDKCSPRSCAPLFRRVVSSGCVLSELPCGARVRHWSHVGRMRIVGLLARLVILVEAEQESRELAGVRLVAARGRTIAAVPGRITSPASGGTNGLLKEGTALVRGARDVLDLLYGASASEPSSPTAAANRLNLDRRLEALGLNRRLYELLRRIGEGTDTISKLGAEREGSDAVLRGLAELELKGLVRRGDGGRYVPCTVTLHG
jgi:DNA processing protein